MAQVFEIPFAQFTPDGGRLSNPGLLSADNVAPYGASGFVPLVAVNKFAKEETGTFPAIVGATLTNSVSRYHVGGAVVFIPTDETWYKAYLGTVSGIAGQLDKTYLQWWKFEKDGTVTQNTAALSTATSVQDEGWFFQVYGNSVVAVCGHDGDPQIDVDATEEVTGFEDLWDSSPAEPRAKYVSAIGLHLLLGNIKESGIVYPNRVWWSQTDNVRFFSTADVDPDKRTGYQDLNDEYGPITGLTGGTDYAYVAKARCWYRMDFGGPFDYIFRPFGIGKGCTFPHSIINYGDAVYFWSAFGPAVITDTNDPEPLGLGSFNRSIKDDTWVLEHGLGPAPGLPAHRMVGFVDEENELIGWAYNSRNYLEDDPDWLWHFDTVFLYNVRYGRGAVVRNFFTTDALNEDGSEEGLVMETLPAGVVRDGQELYPADWRLAWPLFVPTQVNLDGFAPWAPLLRVHWLLMTKGYETAVVGNTVGWAFAYGDNTESPLVRLRSGFIPVDPENGADGTVKRARLYYSTNVGGEAPEYEVRLYTLTDPTGTPRGPVVANKHTDRGWVTFPSAPNAPLAQFEVRIKNPVGVGEIEKLEVEVEFAGVRR